VQGNLKPVPSGGEQGAILISWVDTLDPYPSLCQKLFNLKRDKLIIEICAALVAGKCPRSPQKLEGVPLKGSWCSKTQDALQDMD
jgi:hypothetical protein